MVKRGRPGRARQKETRVKARMAEMFATEQDAVDGG